MAEKLILTVRNRLEAKYGGGPLSSIESKLTDYLSADAARGVNGRILYADDPSRTGFGAAPVSTGFPPNPSFAPNSNASELDRWIREVNDFCRAVKSVVDTSWSEYEFDYLMIVGGNDVLPFFRAPNPASPFSDDPDTTVPTDNPYASPSLNAGLDMYSFLVPEIPLGRIPDIEGASDPSFLLAVLDSGIAEASREQEEQSLSWNGWTLTTESWENLSTHLSLKHNIPQFRINVSPPIMLRDHPTPASSGATVHYFNLHGGLRTGLWFGEPARGGSMPDAFGPASIPSLGIPAGVSVMTEACYGGDLLNRRQPQSSALTYLVDRCSTFVGSSTVSYGTSGPPGNCADVIADEFLTHMRSGESSGASLVKAKQNMAAEVSGPFGGLDAGEQKTLFQFSLFGDPSHHPFQIQIRHYLDEIRPRREALKASIATVRTQVFPFIQTKATVTVGLDQLPDAADRWLREIEERLPRLTPKGQVVETFQARIKPVSDLTVAVPEARAVFLVQRAFADPETPKVSDPEAQLPSKIYLASAFFSEGRLLRESVVISK